MVIVLRLPQMLPLLGALEIPDQPRREIGDASPGMSERVLADVAPRVHAPIWGRHKAVYNLGKDRRLDVLNPTKLLMRLHLLARASGEQGKSPGFNDLRAREWSRHSR